MNISLEIVQSINNVRQPSSITTLVEIPSDSEVIEKNGVYGIQDSSYGQSLSIAERNVYLRFSESSEFGNIFQWKQAFKERSTCRKKKLSYKIFLINYDCSYMLLYQWKVFGWDNGCLFWYYFKDQRYLWISARLIIASYGASYNRILRKRNSLVSMKLNKLQSLVPVTIIVKI